MLFLRFNLPDSKCPLFIRYGRYAAGFWRILHAAGVRRYSRTMLCGYLAMFRMLHEVAIVVICNNYVYFNKALLRFQVGGSIEGRGEGKRRTATKVLNKKNKKKTEIFSCQCDLKFETIGLYHWLYNSKINYKYETFFPIELNLK